MIRLSKERIIMVAIFVALVIMFVAVMGICFIAYFVLKNSSNKMSVTVVEHFEPGNVAPELTKMIEYHKNNDLVDYEI